MAPRALPRFATWFKSRYMSQPSQIVISTVKMLAAAHFCIEYGFMWGTVSGPSMLPFWDVFGDGALTSRLHRRGKDVKVGDLVEFKVPIHNGVAIKRVAGLPGDYVLCCSPESRRDEMIQVPEGHVWVLGDNVPASRDSRIYGPIPMALITGKVIYRTGSYPWEINRIQKIENPLEKPHSEK